MSDKSPTDWQIRVPRADELREFARPVQMAFGGGFSDEDLDDWLKQTEPDRFLGAFAPGSDLVVGAAMSFLWQLTVPGGEVSVAAVSGVGVRPDHRRRGVLSALMARQLADAHERREAVAVLWASEGAIYQRYGYGLAAFDGYLEVDTGRTAFAGVEPAEGRVRIVDERESAEVIPPIYEATRATTAGALSRSEQWWTGVVLADPESSRRGAGPKFRVVFEVAGQPEGYAIYRVRDEWDERGPKSVLEVLEAVTSTPRSVRGLWRYLFDVDLVRTVKSWHGPVPSPLQHVLTEPRALGLMVKDGLWLRLLDLPAALMARRYGATDSLVLEVLDALCPHNTGRWRLRTAGEPGVAAAAVEPTDDAADLVLGTADLAAIYLGGVRPQDLAGVGRISQRTPGSVRRVAALFAADQAPWCASMF